MTPSAPPKAATSPTARSPSRTRAAHPTTIPSPPSGSATPHPQPHRNPLPSEATNATQNAARPRRPSQYAARARSNRNFQSHGAKRPHQHHRGNQRHLHPPSSTLHNPLSTPAFAPGARSRLTRSVFPPSSSSASRSFATSSSPRPPRSPNSAPFAASARTSSTASAPPCSSFAAPPDHTSLTILIPLA